MHDFEIQLIRSENSHTLTLSGTEEGSENCHTITLGTPTKPGDYNALINKPKINGFELSGNVTLEDIGLGNVPYEPLSSEELEEILGGEG